MRQHPERRPAVVAGASSGIGAATALALAAAGHPVALGARRVDRLAEQVMRIREAGGEAIAHPLDVTDDASVGTFADAVRRDLGDVEVLVASAALSIPSLLVEQPVADVAAILDANVVGAQRLIRAFVPGMVERRRGDAVFISSDSMQTLRPRTAAYNASKAALDTLVLTLARELEGTGVRASIVRPGPTRSEMGGDWPDDQTIAVIEDWARWGLARHSDFLPPEAIASAVATVVAAPPGVHLTAIDVQPEAPVEER